MKITKFEQSCLFIELEGNRILIDPGAVPFGQKRSIADLGRIDAIFFTHEHADHFDKDAAEKYCSQIPVYVNESTSRQINGTPKIIKDQETISIGALKIQARELAHSLMPDGSPGPQNTGYLVNDILFHPGDGINLEGLSVKYLALPITGPDISPKDALGFARQVSAEKALAIHYDNFGADPDFYSKLIERYNQPFELIGLAAGESMEIA